MGIDHQNENRNGSEMSMAPALCVSELTQEFRVPELSCRRLFEAAQDGILILDGDPGAVKIVTAVRREEARLKARALQNTTFNSASFPIIAMDLAPLNPSTPPALLKATKPTTTLQRRVQTCRRTMQRMPQESYEKRNQHTIETLPGHRAGQ